MRTTHALTFAVGTLSLLALGSGRALSARFVPLGDLPGGIFQSTAIGISADGKVVVGGGSPVPGEFFFAEEAFRWTESTGMVGLSHLPGPRVFSEAFSASADGSVVVGISDSRLLT